MTDARCRSTNWCARHTQSAPVKSEKRIASQALRSGVSRVSKDEITELEDALTIIPLCGKTSNAPDGVLLAAVDGLRHDCGN
jgi:hypothetical protein